MFEFSLVKYLKKNRFFRPLKVVSNLNHPQVASSKPALRMCKCVLLDLDFYNKAREMEQNKSCSNQLFAC